MKYNKLKVGGGMLNVRQLSCVGSFGTYHET